MHQTKQQISTFRGPWHPFGPQHLNWCGRFMALTGAAVDPRGNSIRISMVVAGCAPTSESQYMFFRWVGKCPFLEIWDICWNLYPPISHWNAIFHCKPSILGYPHVWNIPVLVGWSSIFDIYQALFQMGNPSRISRFQTRPEGFCWTRNGHISDSQLWISPA